VSTFIALLTFTNKDDTGIEMSSEYEAAFERSAQRFGVEITETYRINGKYDAIHIFKGKNEDAAIAYSLSLTSDKNIRFETYLAHSDVEMKRILKKVFNPYDLLRSELEDYDML